MIIRTMKRISAWINQVGEEDLDMFEIDEEVLRKHTAKTNERIRKNRRFILIDNDSEPNRDDEEDWTDD